MFPKKSMLKFGNQKFHSNNIFLKYTLLYYLSTIQMANMIKTFLDLFIAASLLITFGQDIYRMTSSNTSPVRSSSHDVSSQEETIKN